MTKDRKRVGRTFTHLPKPPQTSKPVRIVWNELPLSVRERLSRRFQPLDQPLAEVSGKFRLSASTRSWPPPLRRPSTQRLLSLSRTNPLPWTVRETGRKARLKREGGNSWSPRGRGGLLPLAKDSGYRRARRGVRSANGRTRARAHPFRDVGAKTHGVRKSWPSQVLRKDLAI